MANASNYHDYWPPSVLQEHHEPNNIEMAKKSMYQATSIQYAKLTARQYKTDKNKQEQVFRGQQ